MKRFLVLSPPELPQCQPDRLHKPTGFNNQFPFNNSKQNGQIGHNYLSVPASETLKRVSPFFGRSANFLFILYYDLLLIQPFKMKSDTIRLMIVMVTSLTVPFVACSRQEKIPALPFNGDFLRAPDDSRIINFISKDELELRTNGTTFVGKYTINDSTVRAIVNISGSTHAFYYAVHDYGVSAEDGTVLYEPSAFADFQQSSQFKQRAQEAMLRKEYDVAIASYTEGLKFNPRDGEGFRERGRAYEAKNEYEKALRDYSSAVQCNPRDVEAYSQRINILEFRAYDETGKRRQATPSEMNTIIADYCMLIRLQPDNEQHYFGRAHSYHKILEYDKAIEDYGRLKSYISRGRVYYDKGDYKSALADFLTASNAESKRDEMIPHLANLVWFLAVCPDATFRDGTAAVEGTNLINDQAFWMDFHSTQTTVFSSRAAAYAENGNFKEAIKWQQECLRVGTPHRDVKWIDTQRERLNKYKENGPLREGIWNLD